MADTDLRSFAARTEAILERAPPASRIETATLVVAPLLQSLGWPVCASACSHDRRLGETTLEYVCHVEDTPALLVAVEPYKTGLDDRRAEALAATMRRTRVDRTIYTDGRRVCLLAGAESIDRHRCELLTGETFELLADHYSRRALSGWLDGDSREAVARRLALDRAALRAEIVDELAGTVGDGYGRELEVAVDRFLEDLVDSFGGNAGRESPDRSGAATEPRSQTATGTRSTEDDDETSASPRVPANGGGTLTGGADERDEDGEFVVRFFGERGSIGAIGHSTSRGALVQATEFLLERGLSGVELPWVDEEEVVLAAEPLEEPNQQLSNGWYLNTAGDRVGRAERVRALASRAGLRAMVTGDWKRSRGSQ